jgi:hypothetical protein
MPRSNALVATFGLLVAIGYGFAGCGFAPAASGGSGASSGTPLGTAASSGSGTGLVGGGAAQNGHAAVTGMNCAMVQQPLAKLPPDILIILDASGSMNNDISDANCGNNGCGATSKWAQMTPAINTVVNMTQGTVNWGLKFFADTDATCGVGNTVAVPIGANNATPVANAIMGRTSANGGVTNGSRTPTRLAEDAGAAYVRGLNDQNPRFILLATDGLPNCAPGASDTAADDSAGAVMAVANAASMGVPTFVVGVATSGMGTADTTLSNMATAGGYPRAGSPAYYNVGSTAEFVSVLQTLVGVAGSCTFTVPTAPSSDTDAAHIGVIVDGKELTKDTSHANGWDYTSTGMTAVQVYGPTCDAIMNGSAKKVEIVFKCIIT